jgi:hypothetical protein
MRKIALAGAGISCAAIAFATSAIADPTAGHGTIVHTQTPPMICQIGSDDATPEIGPNVVCQGGFPQAPVEPCPTWPGEKCPQPPMHQDQAVVTASGQFSYRDANIGVGHPYPPFDTLVPGQTYHIQGWTIAASDGGITFTNDGTGHGMAITGDGTVNPL